MDLIPVESLEDPRLAPYRNVRDAHLTQHLPRQPGRLFMAEGEVVVRQLIAASLRSEGAGGAGEGGGPPARFEPYAVHSILLTPTRLETMRDALTGLAAGTPVYVVSQAVMDGVAGFHIHRGVLAAGIRREEPPLETLLQGGYLLVLEDLANHDNVGGAFRNAAAFGAAGVLLSPRCTDPLYRKALRVSAGHVLSVPFARAELWPAALSRVREAGWRLAAMVTDTSATTVSEWVASAPEKTALIVGAEGPGVSGGARAIADDLVRIPMAPGVDSLNVAVAAAIGLQALHARWR